jgi:ribosomal protein L11 methyltransferase
MGSRKIVTVPAWEERAPREGEVLLRINLGGAGPLAFGFGSHPTTSLCLSILAGLYGEGAPRPRRVLDVGCGTGVLAIACALLGAEEVTGIDVADAALEVAPGNASLNGVSGKCRFSRTPVQDVKGEFDLVLANLLGPLLRDLCAPLCARARGGLLLLSGFKEAERETLLDLFPARGFAQRTSLQSEGWGAALFKSLPAPAAGRR